MPQKRLSPSLSAPRAPLPSRNGFTAWWFGACLTWLTPCGSHCALWVWGEVLLARFKAFVGVWRGLVETHDKAQRGKAVAESAQRNVKLALAKRVNEAGLSPDCLFSCRPPRNLDSRAFITIGDKVRVSGVSLFACFPFCFPWAWRALWIVPCNLSDQECSLTGYNFAGMGHPTAGPFPCGAGGCPCVFRVVTAGELNVSPHL